MTDREVQQSPEVVGIDERPIYGLNISNWGNTPSSVSVACYRFTNGAWVDVTALCFPAGSSSVSGNVITLPVFVPQAIGDGYRIEVKFTISTGSILEAYALVNCER